jgi:hypothetical protein
MQQGRPRLELPILGTHNILARLDRTSSNADFRTKVPWRARRSIIEEELVGRGRVGISALRRRLTRGREVPARAVGAQGAKNHGPSNGVGEV